MAERPQSQGLPGELVSVPGIKFHHGAQRQGLSRGAGNMQQGDNRHVYSTSQANKGLGI